MVDMMVKVDETKYTTYARYEYGNKVLYLKMLKSLYGCIKSRILSYKLFVTTLKKQGFELNPYDLCITNKIVDGK